MPATVTLHSVKGLSPVHKPTQEQADAIDNFKTGQNLKINAFAGTGKTSTLQMLGECSSKRGLYLAFNRSIADDAQKRFPSNITCQTTHSLAYRATPSAYRTIKGKMTNRYSTPDSRTKATGKTWIP